VLFTTAGMHPLIPYLLGDEHPDGSRLVNIQRSLRTGDIDEVGDATHLTFFEMLGHWSLGDYFKREAITWSYRFATEELQLPKDKLAVTIYAGETSRGIGSDEEAAKIWRSLGVERIDQLTDDNWWGPVHATGPCGPTTEIFVWTGNNEPPTDSLPGNDDRWVEIWNNVFMEFNKTTDATYQPLKQKNIDTGVGLERVLMVVNGYESVYQIDLFEPLIAAISPDKSLAHADRDVRVVADHIRAAVFLIADGVEPSNKDRGYVLRRLIRRAVHVAGRLDPFNWPTAVEAVVGAYADEYPHLLERPIAKVFMTEQSKFYQQLERAKRFIAKSLEKSPVANAQEAAALAFLAYQSHALPLELGYELIEHHVRHIDRNAFESSLDALVQAHQEISRAGSEKKFGGHGLILDTGELKATDEAELQKVLRLHTATHILQAALRHILGDHVQQKGSDINPERLRFDFTHSEKLTDNQIRAVEAWANDIVDQDLPMQSVDLPLHEAERTGALHFFNHKYPPIVTVYYLGNDLTTAASKEFCGGPHVARSGEVGRITITKEQSAGAGIRRIKAIVA